ncbi:MAG: hypothetical protein ACLVEV_09265 [Lachnospiraceae bacterium]|uniref:hypothetical protein n=1 Tax=Parablautia sp. Marseille-Q6255 TaxID=3039593 RepID=UPI0024BCF77F|nr:hypothetical protein [Parablautia sp. Marseille-Q6255]
MTLKYPAEAFALGVILFSTGMKEAFAAGILIILTVVFAELLKNLLEKAIPAWSLKLCVPIASAALCASVFLVGFSALGTELSTEIWIMTLVIGLLCARHVLSDSVQADYGDLMWESAIAWGFWILLSIVREFMGNGTVFGNFLIQTDIQSATFLESTFAFLTSGLVLAFTNGVLKKSCIKLNSLLVFIPAAIFVRPFTMDSFGKLVGIAWAILVPVVLFLSVKQILKFSRTGKAYRGLPSDMLAAGFIYMILSIY